MVGAEFPPYAFAGTFSPKDDELPEGPACWPTLAKYFSRFGFAPIARLIILSMRPTVWADTLTAVPLYECTVARFLRVFSEVRNVSARGGTGGGFVPVGVDIPVPEVEGEKLFGEAVWCGEGVEWLMYKEDAVVIVVIRTLVVIEIAWLETK